MSYGPQYVMVTKQRKKTGCFGMSIHLVLTVCTLGIWLFIGPLFHWLWHLIGPRQKAVTKVYGSPQPQMMYQPGLAGASQTQWEQWRLPPGQAPQQGYTSPSAAPYPQPAAQWPQQPPAYPAPPDQQQPTQPYAIGQPPGAPVQPPQDPWDTGDMRRRG